MTLIRKSLCTLSATLLISQIGAAEVDSFTYRLLPLKDSLATINTKTNAYLKKAIEEANDTKKVCNEKRLYKKMRGYFNNQYRGDLGKELVETQGIDAHWITIEDSIYQDFTWYQSPVQGLWGRIAKDPTAALINVDGHLIGTDKFEHFMGSGYNYFNTYYLKKKDIREALDIGWSAETGMMGSWMTGVMSHGDLVANFNGMRFWNHVLLKNDDILGAQYNLGPYVECIDDQWVITKEIDWANYIDEAFDEGQNCSNYSNETMLALVESQISARAEHFGIDLKCPMNRAAIEPLLEKYGVFADELLNIDGQSVVPKD